MNVTLFTFSKKHNSTAVPTGGTSVDVVLKDEAGVLDPIIELHTSASPSAYNYLYIPTFGRYYWLREWTYNRGIWTGSFYVDPLASWRTQIGAQQLYVFRSAAEWDGRVIDNFYPTVADVSYHDEAIPKIWTVEAASDYAAQGTGLYVVGIYSNASQGQAQYYGLDQTNLNALLGGLFANQYFESILGQGATLTPELKAQIDPLQYIQSIKYFPCAYGGTSSWGVMGYSSSEGPQMMYVGKGFTTAQIQRYKFNNPLVTMTYPISINTNASFTHPQIGRGVYMRTDPYTSWQLYMPPFGLVKIDSSDMIEAELLVVNINVDIRTGSASLDIWVRSTGQTRANYIVHLDGNVGIDIPVRQAIQTGANYMNIGGSILHAGASLLKGDIGGVFNSAQNMIGEFAKGQVPHLSTIGSQGSENSLWGYPLLTARFTMAADDDLAGRGRPLCSKRLISSIPGYITADPDELSIAATARELEEIRGFISGGFFYE